LRHLVAPGTQRQDRVIVSLRERGAVATEPAAARDVGLEDPLIDGRFGPLHPREQRRPEVEAHPRVVADDLLDVAAFVEDARRGVRAVALRGDALVPVVEGIGGVLVRHRLEPGGFSGRLIEVAVNADVAIHPRGSGANMTTPSGGNVTESEYGLPCTVTSSAVVGPWFPTPLPP